MDNSVTFMVNHQGMSRGIYLAKVDRFMGTATITLDLRVRRPYEEDSLSASDMHTCEHSFATCVRDEAAGNADFKVIYFGPMGCATGFYLLLQFADGLVESGYFETVCRLLKNACRRMEKMTAVPAANKYQCGNFRTLGLIDSALQLAHEIGALVDAAVVQKGFHQYHVLTEQELACLLQD